MLSKLASVVFLLTSVLIGIGSLGHAHQWGPLVHSLGGVRPEIVELLKLVWFWVSGTMAVFGVLLVWTWWHIRSGNRALYLIPWLISGFYFVGGVWGVRYVGAFFSLFIVLSATLCATTWVLYRGAIARGPG